MYLLRLEWLKWRRHRFFLLLLAVYVVALPSILLTMRHLPETPWVSPRIFYIFPSVWGFLGYVGNWMAFFCFGFLAIGMVTLEQSFRTQRQNIITGLSRWQYLRGKITFLAAVALAATLYYVICALLIGLAHTESLRWSKVWQDIHVIPTYFLMC
ncbi:MAG: ABC transporter permease, partial [Lewinella sp.]|nr:ABC transporter permease [Lewinella sp.]